MAETPAPVRTLEQGRAAYALKKIREHEQDDAKARERYLTLVRGLPAMVLMNGLGQALAYLCANAEKKTDSPPARLYQELSEWLAGPRTDERRERVYAAGDLLTSLIEGSRDDYQRAQAAALRLLAWQRKFADAFPEGDPGR
jgi:CRISPR-associated protein Cmr5